MDLSRSDMVYAGTIQNIENGKQLFLDCGSPYLFGSAARHKTKFGFEEIVEDTKYSFIIRYNRVTWVQLGYKSGAKKEYGGKV